MDNVDESKVKTDTITSCVNNNCEKIMGTNKDIFKDTSCEEKDNENSTGGRNVDPNNEVEKVLNIDENSIQMESDAGGNDKMDIQNANSEEGEKIQKRKRKHTRRGNKKNKPRKPRQKFKPYNTLTWDEKRKLVEIDSVRAMQRRKELMLQKGCPIAPYNTTQFLMEEHAVPENLEEGSKPPPDNNNTDPRASHDDETSSSSVSDDEYFDKDFNDFYETVHMDTLNSYSKEHLISYIYELERKIEALEKCARTTNPQVVNGDVKVEELKGEVGQRAI